VLRKLFGPKRDEVSWLCTILYKEEVYGLYRPPNIGTVLKFMRLQLAGYVSVNKSGERQGMHTEFWWGNLLENGCLEDQGGDG
jgi:hypothetical protein